MTAFAVAAAVALLAPRLRWPVLGLAALIGFSRVYLGVHFWLDVLAGAALGLAIGLSVGVVGPRARAARHAGAGSTAGTRRRLSRGLRARRGGQQPAARVSATEKRPTCQPMIVPTATSSGKCAPNVMRVTATAAR